MLQITTFSNSKIFFIKKLNIFFIFFLIIASTSCGDISEEFAAVEITSLKPTGTHSMFPIESKDQLNVVMTAEIINVDNSDEIDIKWKISKILYDVKDSTLIKNEYINDSDYGDNQGYFLERSKDGLSAYISLFEKGSYLVTYTVNDYKTIKKSSIILKNGVAELPNLFVSFNIPSDKKNVISSYSGSFSLGVSSVFAGTQDMSDDRLYNITAETVGNTWFDTGLLINPLEPFSIYAGIPAYYRDNTDDIHILPIDDLLKVTDNSGVINTLKSQIDVTGDKLEIDLVTDKLFIKTAVFSVLHYWMHGLKEDTYKFSTKMIYGDDYPVYEEIKDRDVYSAKLFVGSVGLLYSHSKTYTYFTVEGLKSSFIDINNNRPYPGLPFGYLIGKIGADGTPFPIGARYDNMKQDSVVIYELIDEKFVVSKK